MKQRTRTSANMTILRRWIGEVETLRDKRRAEWRERQHPMHKRFTQEEICLGPCPTYRNLLLCRSQRLPRRETVLAIATYLECSAQETNDLLTAAQYVPETVPLTEQQYRRAAEQAELVADMLPLPAVVLGLYGDILNANHAALKINHLPDVSLWAREQRDFVRWVFDSDLPTYEQYYVSPDQWQVTARGIVEVVYLANRQYLNDAAFRLKRESLSVLPEFAAIWNSVCAAPPAMHEVYGRHHFQAELPGEASYERTVLLPISEQYEVSLVIGLPLNAAAYAFYESLGCALNSTRWEALLADYSANVG